MDVTLEGSNSAETLPPWGGVARIHRHVTRNWTAWWNNHNLSSFLLPHPPASWLPDRHLKPHIKGFFLQHCPYCFSLSESKVEFQKLKWSLFLQNGIKRWSNHQPGWSHIHLQLLILMPLWRFLTRRQEINDERQHITGKGKCNDCQPLVTSIITDTLGR